MADNQFIVRKGYIALEDSQITGSLSVTNSVTASFFTGSFIGDGSQLSGVSAGFPFTGSATISGSLQVTGSISTDTDATINSLTVGKGGGNLENNTVLGYEAFISNVEGEGNVAVGYKALSSSLAGMGPNTAVGNQALRDNVYGFRNTAIGNATLLSNNNGIFNTAVGHIALANNIDGSYNNAVGDGALYENTSGENNIAIGHDALHDNTEGDNNVAIGNSSLYNNITGSNNTAIGTDAGQYAGASVTSLTSVDNSIFIGYQSRALNAVGDTNEIVIGYNVVGSGSNTTVIGNNSTVSTTLKGAVSASIFSGSFVGDGSQLTGIADPTPITATINNTNSPFTITSQSIVIIDSTNGDVTVNLPDLDVIDGTPDQKPILLYKNDYSQNVIYVQPSGSQLVNGTTQDIIVSIQIAIAYNPTSAGWVTEGTSYQSLAELELFFVPRTETGSFATTGSNQFSGSQTITGSLTVTGNITGNITGSASTASYVEYANVANKPAIVSGSSQITYSGLTGIPSGILSGSAQIADFGIFATTGSNQFNGNQSITGSLTVSGQVVAQTLNVQQVTSSIVYSSGSNIFGNSLANTQQFTGSVGVTGSLTVNGQGYFGSTNYSNVIVDGTNATGWGNNIAFRSQGTDFGYLGSIGSLLGNTTKDMAIWATSGNGIRFYTNGNNLRATIDTSGNLGLGVTPSAWGSPFVVSQYPYGSYFGGTTTGGTVMGNNNYYNGSNYIYTNSDYATQYQQGSGTHFWRIAPSGTAGNAISFTQAMTLDANGRLGIGLTSPPARLSLVGGSTMQFGIDGNSGNNSIYLRGGSTGDKAAITLNHYGYADYHIAVGHAANTLLSLTKTLGGTDGIIINSSGNVGVGTTSPARRLQVEVGSTAQGGQNWSHSNGTVFARLGIVNPGVDNNTEFGSASNNDLVLLTVNTERMRITSGGNVLIGTTSDPGYKLTVSGNIYLPTGANREIYIGSASAYNYRIRVTGDDFIIREADLVDRLKYVYADTRWYITGGLTISGSLSKGSGSFKIDHPLPSKKNTHHLVHSFIEGPQADNIYRGKIQLVNGKATINLDQAARMTEGTFVLLNGNIQCFTSNESGWTAVKGIVEENILTIEAQDANCVDTVSWLVVGERIDQHMLDTEWTDENGKVITEPLKQ